MSSEDLVRILGNITDRVEALEAKKTGFVKVNNIEFKVEDLSVDSIVTKLTEEQLSNYLVGILE